MKVGVDEAGKGPVLGSMFAAAVRAPSPAIPDGVRDSKDLVPERREELARRLRADDRVAIGVAEIPVARIDDPATDMNELTVRAQARALDDIVDDGDAIYLDAGDVDAGRFERRVGDHVDTAASLHGEHGADETYPIVAAASIVAKVDRDAHVRELATTYGEVGSGYPSDERTRAFLEEYLADHRRLPDCARETWQTSRDLLAAAEQTGLQDYTDH